jgi:4-amino-4-deoxy-L-arabinose transferase-like glycosyltransferase
MENNRHNAKITKGLIVCGVLLLSAVSAAWMFSEEAMGNHECFISVTAREMLASGDWVWPTFNGQPRLVKTPLSYWLVAGLAKITGRVDEFTARLPSVIFAVLSVVAILYFVNQWLSFRVAVLSASVWTTSLGYIRYSHNARPEMALTFFILLCFLSFYSAVTAKGRDKHVVYMLIFWISFAFANLAKGPIPLPLVLIPLFFYVAIFRQWRRLFDWVSVIGFIIFLAIVLPWPLAIAHKLNWDLRLWKKEFVDRFLGEYRPGGKPFFYYSFIMFQFIIPWVAFLPMALAAPFYRVWNKKRPVMQFLWLWFVMGIVFLTISGGKRQHYIIPLMPAMAILIGILIEDMVFVLKAYDIKFAKTVLVGHVIGIIALAVAGSIYVIKVYPDMTTEAIILGAATIIFTVAVFELFAVGKPAFACGTFFGGIIMLFMVGYMTFLNPLDYDKYSRDFSRRLAQIVPQSDNLIAYEYISDRSVHYFGRVIPEVMDKSILYERYERGDWVVATAGHMAKLTQDGRFRKIYYTEKAEHREGGDVPGALFHKSAPFVAKEP